MNYTLATYQNTVSFNEHLQYLLIQDDNFLWPANMPENIKK